MEISSAPAQEEAVPEPPKTGFWGFMHVTGTKIINVMDYVGETVVGVLGLDDSKFQYVMDGMDKEDWERAVAIDRERRLEDAILDAAEELQAQDSQLQAEGSGEGDVEGGGGGGGDVEQKKIKDYMNLVRDQATAEFWEKEIAEHPEVEREIRQVVPDDITPIVRLEGTHEVVRSEEVDVIVSAVENSETTTTTTTTTIVSINETTTESY